MIGVGRRRSAWLLVVLAAYLLCVGVRLAACDFDISRFIVAGDAFVDRSRLRYPIAVEPRSSGYDGQYFYRLALDPLDTRRDAYGISMQSHPAVRAQRIVYPVATWLVSLGRGAAVPYGLVIVNLIAIVALGWVAIRLAADAEVPARLGLLIPFFPGFVLSICRDTAEIVATALALGGLLAARTRHWPIAALLASLAVLTREATLLYLAGYGLVALWRTLRTRSFDTGVAWCLIPVCVYAVWQLHIHAVWSSYSFDVVGHDDFSPVPLIDYARATSAYALTSLGLPIRYSVVFSLVMCLAFGAFVIFVFRQLWTTKFLPPEVAIPSLLYAGMAAAFSQAVWRDPWGYVRIANDFYVLGIVMLVVSHNIPALRKLAPAVGLTWIASLAYVI